MWSTGGAPLGGSADSLTKSALAVAAPGACDSVICSVVIGFGTPRAISLAPHRQWHQSLSKRTIKGRKCTRNVKGPILLGKMRVRRNLHRSREGRFK